MDNRKLEQLKQEHIDIQIPEELDLLVRSSIKQGRKNMKRKNNIKKIKIASASVAASVVLLTAGVNTSPVLADTLSKVPVVGGIVQVLTFREYKVDENNYDANIKVPEIQGLENKELQNSLNEKYLNESKELYDQFMKDIKELEEAGGGHLGVDNGYIVKTDTDKILSIGRYVVNTVASSSTTFRYDTIDKEKQILITLPSLFKDDTYVDIISHNIKSQMKEQMKSDEDKFYWVEEGEESIELFEKISNEQSFYINDKGKLVISFDKYEVAPGYMGTPEFVVPTEAISDILVGNEYIK
ncbi:DUF3298 domain-containing protein [Tissierella carlieri]|mgnify:FL=1|uniref:DUF3298 and DUF4163 domain-containing protein n=1 Tax=Tissierella carlieri TaxID=689904 RepID=UPI002803F6D1|nr:DUF3298 domain-containing protein [uncultured Tissierella sp.]MDU5083424.1 DUF3298 domain-containing protein [Bacillota bacterium]